MKSSKNTIIDIMRNLRLTLEERGRGIAIVIIVL